MPTHAPCKRNLSTWNRYVRSEFKKHAKAIQKNSKNKQKVKPLTLKKIAAQWRKNKSKSVVQTTHKQNEVGKNISEYNKFVQEQFREHKQQKIKDKLTLQVVGRRWTKVKQQKQVDHILKELTGEEKTLIDKVNSEYNEDRDKVIVINNTNNINRNSFWSLQPGTWLNDEVISAYMSLLNQYHHPNKKYWFCNTYFMVKVKQNASSVLKRWSKKAGKSANVSVITDWDKLFIPYNINNNHWYLLEINMNTFEIYNWDSLGSREIPKHLINILNDFFDKKQEWTPKKEHEPPRQLNGCDCGVFTITNAKILGADLPLNSKTYTTKDTEVKLRQRISLELIKGELW